jgi:hypothetical protein
MVALAFIADKVASTWMESMGYFILLGLRPAPGKSANARRNFGAVVLSYSLCNSNLPMLISGELRLPRYVTVLRRQG